MHVLCIYMCTDIDYKWLLFFILSERVGYWKESMIGTFKLIIHSNRREFEKKKAEHSVPPAFWLTGYLTDSNHSVFFQPEQKVITVVLEPWFLMYQLVRTGTSILLFWLKKYRMIGICKIAGQSECWWNGMFHFLFLELLSIGVSN